VDGLGQASAFGRQTNPQDCGLVAVLVCLAFLSFPCCAGSFTKSPQELDRAIQQLDPRLHTMGIIHLLAARAQMPMDDGAVFLEHCLRLFSSGTGEQARMEPKRCVRIVHKLTALATEYAMPLRVITTLEKAIHLVQENEYQLTAVHADLLQVCLLAKHYQRAGEMLKSKPMLNIGDTKLNGFTQSDYLRYWYYAGLVHTGLKAFPDALDAFEQCFSAPAMVLSAPAVEAYKKYLLVSLIHRGVIDTKRSGNPMMMRNLKV
jgi:COP9 signalosome complex subunit 3